MIQRFTHHSAILSPGYISYIEVPATNIKLLHYKVTAANSFIHTMFHAYYPDFSEPNPPVRRASLQKTNLEIDNFKPSQIIN